METRQESISRIFKQFRDLSIKLYTSLSELLITHLTCIGKGEGRLLKWRRIRSFKQKQKMVVLPQLPYQCCNTILTMFHYVLGLVINKGLFAAPSPLPFRGNYLSSLLTQFQHILYFIWNIPKSNN